MIGSIQIFVQIALSILRRDTLRRCKGTTDRDTLDRKKQETDIRYDIYTKGQNANFETA